MKPKAPASSHELTRIRRQSLATMARKLCGLLSVATWSEAPSSHQLFHAAIGFCTCRRCWCWLLCSSALSTVAAPVCACTSAAALRFLLQEKILCNSDCNKGLCLYSWPAEGLKELFLLACAGERVYPKLPAVRVDAALLGQSAATATLAGGLCAGRSLRAIGSGQIGRSGPRQCASRSITRAVTAASAFTST